MTLQERVDAFKVALPTFPDAFPYVSPSGRWLYGTWETGNNYRSVTPFYGAYPPRFLEQAMALFPDHADDRVLHVFSGSLPPGPYTRLDINPALLPDVVGDVRYPPLAPGSFKLVIADTPYSKEDAKQYVKLLPDIDGDDDELESMMPNRRVVMAALAEIVPVGGHLAWLDVQWPMHRKSQWHTFGRLLVQRSTNHRARVLHLFERQ